MQHNNSFTNIQSYRQSIKYARKWTTKEDEKLRIAVEKYGTQWTFIGKRFRFNRSINSLVKRWHGKLKEDAPNKANDKDSDSQSQEEHQQVINRSKRTRKEDKIQQKKRQTRQQTKQQTRQQRHQRRQDKVQEKRQQIKQEKIQEKKPQRREPPKQQRRDVRGNSRNRRYLSKVDRILKQENSKLIKQEFKSDESQSQKSQEEEVDSLTDPENDKYVFQHNWRQGEDYILRESILTEKILNWQELASRLRINDVKEVKKRWQRNIYPSIVDSRKIGGCIKYSEEEDSILSRGVKLGLGINELRRFLPGRTPYSLDARRRRSLRMQEMESPQLRFWTKRFSMYKFVQKRHQHLQKPEEEEFFLYKSDSQ